MNCRITHTGKASFPAIGPIRFTFHAREAVHAARTLNPHMVIPVHYKGWKHFREPKEEAEKQFAAAELGEKVQWLPLGVPVNIEI